MRATIRAAALTALVCAAAVAGGLGKLQSIDLPFPPGERSVTGLAFGADGMLYGTMEHEDGSAPTFFRYDPGGKGVAQPAKALPPEAASPYSLSATGALQKRAADGTLGELGQVAGTRPFEPNGYQVSRALVSDADGNIYTAGKGGAIFRYNPADAKLEALEAHLPAVVGREAWASLDAAVIGPDGLLYGGTFDGYLFTFDPAAGEVVNLGKPLRQQRIQGLAFSGGKLYGIGGEPEGLPRSFAFDPVTRSFELGGTLKSDLGNIYEPIGAMVADPDGNIYIGVTGRLGNLFMWRAGEQ